MEWRSVNAALFTLPKLEYSGPPLRFLPEAEAVLKRRQWRMVSIARNFFSVIPCLYWLPGIACVLNLAALLAGDPFMATIAMMCCIGGWVIFVPVCLYAEWFLRRTRKLLTEYRKQALAHAARPAWDIEDAQCRDHFCRHFGPEEAFWALWLVEAAGVAEMMYPDDVLMAVCGGNYFDVLTKLKKTSWVKTPEMTLREAAYNCILPQPLRENSARSDIVLPDPPEIPAEAPPLSGYAGKVVECCRGEEWPKLSEEKIQGELLRRPEITGDLFASYWPTRREAAIALTLRNLAVDQMDRPEALMCYPNDPMAFLTYVADDSMESIELILSMEWEFNIVIPDSEAVGVLRQMNLAQAVQYIMEKQDGVAREEGEGKPE